MTWLLVIAGAAVGAPLRYLTDQFVQGRHDTVFPWGTMSVNVAGSLILGTMSGAAAAGVVDDRLRLLIGVGLCGALTTYSTLSYETFQLTRSGARFYAVANLAVTLIGGLGAYYTGTTFAHAILA
jgi:CrcB protein